MLSTELRPEADLGVCLLAPLPPPYGGIAHWAQMMVARSARYPGLRLEVIDTAPRWRSIHAMGIWRRVVGGGIQLCRDAFRFYVALLRLRPDVVHLTTSGHLAIVRDIVVLSLAALSRVGSVYHLHFGRVPALASAGGLEWRALRLAMRLASCVVAIDSNTHGAIRRNAPRARVTCVPNFLDPVELPEPGAEPSGLRTVVYVGWVIPAKGIGELVDAWKLVRPEGWVLRIVGPADPSYQRMLAERCTGESIEFAGELPHSTAMMTMAKAEFVVLPSHTEGFPYVVLEAMMLGKPVVATNVGAIPDMLAGGCGTVVEPKDVPGLANALGQALSDSAWRCSAGAAARHRALAKYSVEAVFAQHAALWRSVRRSPAAFTPPEVS